MNEPVTPEFLKTLAFLAPATDEELRALVPAARIETHPSGTVLFREGDLSTRVFIVTGGTVALEVIGANHRAQRFQTISAGELLGWSPLLGSGPMTASARALTDVRVVVIDAKALLQLCDQDPRFGFQFMRCTAAAIAARLSATRLQMLDVYRAELPTVPPGGAS
jgi:CRP-like cAMP-binding protein